MLAELFQQPPAPADRPVLWSAQGSVSWSQMRDELQQASEQLGQLAGQRVGLLFRPTAAGLGTLAALGALQADAVLLDAQLPEGRMRQLARQLRLAAVVDDPADAADGRTLVWRGEPAGTAVGQGTVTILTSGTTGEPKAARHAWKRLIRPVRPAPPTQWQRWLLSYRPHLYAGLQVLLQALLSGGSLVVPSPEAAPDQIAELMARHGTTHASATPSYWRRLLLFTDHRQLAAVPLRQITLGGEAVDQQILDQLQAIYPAARITHIYATTELGRCFAISDKRAGFPAALLQQTTDEGVQLRVVDGQLYVRSANAMTGYDKNLADAPQASPETWFPTGDLVQQEGDRIRFVGRRSDVINVGGNKVAPLEVEQLIRTLPEVADVRVYGQASSLAGQLVACQIVPAAEVSPETARQAVMAACAERLNRYQRPRLIEVIDHIPLTQAGKTKRGRSSF